MFRDLSDISAKTVTLPLCTAVRDDNPIYYLNRLVLVLYLSLFMSHYPPSSWSSPELQANPKIKAPIHAAHTRHAGLRCVDHKTSHQALCGALHQPFSTRRCERYAVPCWYSGAEWQSFGRYLLSKED